MEKDGHEYKHKHSCGGNIVNKIILLNEEIMGISSIGFPYCKGCGSYIATGFCGKKGRAEFKEPEGAVNYLREIIENKPRGGYW
jgi:hypothetical protein